MSSVQSQQEPHPTLKHDTLFDLRTRMLNRLVWVILVLGGAATVVASIEEARNGRYIFAVIYGIAYSLVAVFFASRNMSYSLRSWVLMLVLLIVGFSELCFYGYASLAFLFFFMTITFCGVLLGLKAGIVTLVLCMFATAIAAGLYSVKVIPIKSQVQRLSLNPWHWVSPSVTFLFLATVSVMFLSLLMRGLERYIRFSGEYMHRAEKELADHRDRLEEIVKARTRELLDAQAELIKRERLAILGQLTATVSHEIRNPLGTVKNALFSIRESQRSGETGRLVRAFELGAADYVTKPFQTAELMARVRTQLALKRGHDEREALIHRLEMALSKVKQLSGLLPICANCKKIRDDTGYWSQVEEYIENHSEAEFSHGICPDCMQVLYGDLLKEKST